VQNRRIVLIAFKFPPYDEVGARRWTKLAKYLARDGVTVDVVSVAWPGRSGGLSDVADPRIRVHRTWSLGPHVLKGRRYPRTTWGRVRGRLRKLTLSGLQLLGLTEDARLWGLTMLPAVSRLVRQGDVSAVVVTGAPFRANLWASRLRRRFPDLRLIQEFRDPWADLPAVQSGRKSRRIAIQRDEREVLESASAIVTVAEGLSEILRARTSNPVITIRNGFDEEDMPRVPRSGERPFTLLHAGNLYVGREAPLTEFTSALRAVRAEMPELRVEMFGGFPASVRATTSDLEEAGILRINARVPSAEILEHIAQSFACLQFTAKELPYALSTKIYEYASLHRPVVSINYGGDIADMVASHHLGWNARADRAGEVANVLRQAYATWRENPSYEIEPQGLEAFRYDNLARDYERVLFGSESGAPESASESAGSR
jgi:glycosyltransferase involved in cell wall biosynthesis